jgi:hypothetical protein
MKKSDFNKSLIENLNKENMDPVLKDLMNRLLDNFMHNEHEVMEKSTIDSIFEEVLSDD